MVPGMESADPPERARQVSGALARAPHPNVPPRQRSLGVRRALFRLLSAAALAALAGCAGEFDTVGEPLRVVQPTLPNAVVREPYEATLHAVGGLRPYDYELQSGALPEGVTLQSGTLRGTPTELGSFQFTVAVSDANLNNTVQEYRLTVTEVPPPTFTLNAPQTEVRAAVTLRGRALGARGLSAVRALVTWDPALFSLRQGSVSATTRDLALLSNEAEGQLQVDVAALGRTLDGDHDLFSLTLEPLVEATNLWLDVRVEFMSTGADATMNHHFARQSEGRRPTATTGAPGAAQEGATDEEPGGEPGDGTDEEPGDGEDEDPFDGDDDDADGGGES